MNAWLNDIAIEDIPSEQMRAIAESCGINDAIALMLHVPGIEIYVPKITTIITNKDISNNQYMKIVSERCGYGVAARLIINRSKLISTVIYIPKNGFDNIKKRYILNHFAGFNTTELALECGVSDRYIQKLVSDMYAKKSQLNLFDVAVK